MIYKINKVDISRKKEGKILKVWDYTTTDETSDLEAYRLRISNEQQATRVSFTYTEVPEELKTMNYNV
jgi:hypothetical protein